MTTTAKVTALDSANWANTLSNLINSDPQVFPQVLHRCLLYGPPATGKSGFAGFAFPDQTVERVLIHSQVPPEELLGMVTLEADNGGTKTVWNDGPIVRAMRNGSPVVLDEIDQISGDMKCQLHSVLDDFEQCSLTLNTGEVIKPKRGFCVIATSNAAPSVLPEALLSRFDLVLYADTPSEGVLNSLHSDYRETAKRSYERQEQLSYTPAVTIRSLLAMSKLEDHVGRDQAASLIFGNIGTDIVAGMASQADQED